MQNGAAIVENRWVASIKLSTHYYTTKKNPLVGTQNK